MTTSIGAISEDYLVDLYNQDPQGYEVELDMMLGKRIDDRGYRYISESEQELSCRRFDFHYLAEAFLGSRLYRRLQSAPWGLRGGRANAPTPASSIGGFRSEAVGGGILGPDNLIQLQGWLTTIDRLLDSRLLEVYSYATMVAKDLMTWRMDVRVQENKIPRYSTPITEPYDIGNLTTGLQPGDELPSGDIIGVYVRANRMVKQGESITVAYESAHFSLTDGLMDAVERIATRFAIVIEMRMDLVLWGIKPGVYKYLDIARNMYLTAGPYVNFLPNNDLKTGQESAVDLANQQLKKQRDPETNLLISPPKEEMRLVCSPARLYQAERISEPQVVLTGGLGTTPSDNQVRADGRFKFLPVEELRGRDLMQLPVNQGGLGLSEAQAEARWLWGSPKRAITYMSAWDVRTQRFMAGDSASLSRRDALMQIDLTECGFPTAVEPRYLVLNGIP